MRNDVRILFTFMENQAELVQHRWRPVPEGVGTEWSRTNRWPLAGASISSGHTLLCSLSKASAEAEGWCYFDHRALFSEYTWLVLLLLLLDAILNRISNPCIDDVHTTFFSPCDIPHLTLGSCFLPFESANYVLNFTEEESETAEEWSDLLLS